MTAKVTIHGFPQSSYVMTARAACAAKGVEVDFQPIHPGQHKADEHLVRHPFGKVPSFSHGDFTLFETSAITRYVDAAFEGPALQPADLQARAKMDQWISVVDSYLYTQAVPNYILAYVFPGTEDGSPDRSRIDPILPELAHTMGLFDAALSESSWLVGEDATLADYFFAPLLLGVARLPEGKEIVGGSKNLGRYAGQLMAHPAIQAVLPRD